MWLGIDFGTSNSCASVVLNDSVRLVADPVSKNHVIPSSVYIDPAKGQVLVGQLAENRQSSDARYYQRAFKLQLGQKEPFVFGTYQKYPFQLVSEFMSMFKHEAERQITRNPLTSAVVTVPARYESPLRELMRKAAQQAGFQRIEILEEPVAAAVYYASQTKNKVQDGETFLVYDLGGGTFDAALVRRKGLRYELLGAPDGRQVGGEDFDACIYADVMTKVPAALRERLMQPQCRRERLFTQQICREIKHALSTSLVVKKDIALFGSVVHYQLSREQFVKMIEAHIEETIHCCEGLLKRAGVNGKHVRCVLLVGGSCRIPYIRERLKRQLSIEVFPIDEPELAVSMGAAFFGDALDRAVAFVERVDALCVSKQFHDVLHQHLPELFHVLAQPLAVGLAQEAVKPALRLWQQGHITSLNGIQPDIEARTRQWITDARTREQIRTMSLEWVQRRLPELVRLSDPICDQYRVSRDILRLPSRIPQLEAGLPHTPVNSDDMVDSGAVSGWVSVIVAVVMGIIIAHLHFLAAMAGPVGFIVAAVAIYAGRGKTEEWVRAANLPVWGRKLVLSDEKINTEVGKVETTLTATLAQEMEKNKASFEQFVSEIQHILKGAMHEQATREARFIWLHTNNEQAQAA